MPNLAMRQPATQFSDPDLSLSWPLGGEREVVSVPEEKLTLRIKRRIAEGHIVIVEDAPTTKAEGEAREYRLLTGEEARARMAEPAGPVTRVVYEPATPLDEQDYQMEVQEPQTYSDRFLEAQVARRQAAEEKQAEIAARQAEAEKSAKPVVASEEPDPLAERMRRTEEASAEWRAEQEKAFMVREKARQEIENDDLKHFEARTAATKEKGDTSSDKAFMEHEKARQKTEAKLEKERKAAPEPDSDSKQPVSTGLGGKTDPYVDMSSTGRRAGFGVTEKYPSSTAPEPEPVAATPEPESAPAPAPEPETAPEPVETKPVEAAKEAPAPKPKAPVKVTSKSVAKAAPKTK